MWQENNRGKTPIFSIGFGLSTRNYHEKPNPCKQMENPANGVHHDGVAGAGLAVKLDYGNELDGFQLSPDGGQTW